MCIFIVVIIRGVYVCSTTEARPPEWGSTVPKAKKALLIYERVSLNLWKGYERKQPGQNNVEVLSWRSICWYSQVVLLPNVCENDSVRLKVVAFSSSCCLRVVSRTCSCCSVFVSLRQQHFLRLVLVSPVTAVLCSLFAANNWQVC